jgi:serine phosphatase RsbU (regulator of sigma subunit)
VPEVHDIFKRFANVFDQTYTRFLDLQKSEAQAREAQIDAALERVRSQSMGMQSSKDFSKVTTEMFNQLRQFGGDLFAAGIVFCDKHEGHVEQWHSLPDAGMLSPFIVPVNLDYIHQYRYDQWKKGVELFKIEIPGDFIEQHFKDIFNLPSAQKVLKDFEDQNTPMPETPPWEIDYGASFKQGYILVSSLQPFKEAEILPRFAKVFEQTYTRFNDLQKAEAQAREAQIEASMEKIRSRSLAMQKPEELIEVAEVLRKEMGLLGVEELETSSIYIVDKKNQEAECWYAIKDIREANRKLVSDEMTLILSATWVGNEMWKFYISEKEQTSIVMKGANRKEWINYCADKSKVLQGYYGDEIPERTYHLVKFNGGYMGAASPGDVSSESWDLLKRAAAVFSLAYTRFKDLQDAEARAREAQIEVALERVRSRTMGMQKSEELKYVVATIFEKLSGLNIEMNGGMSIATFVEDSKDLIHWFVNPALVEGVFEMRLNYFPSKVYDDFNDARDNDKEILCVVYNKEELTEYFGYAFKFTGFAIAPDDAKQWVLDQPSFGYTAAIRKHSAIFFNDYTGKFFSEEENAVLLRFSNVFEQAYVRFLDLQKAEAQAREAQIEAALERVRSRTMGMQGSDELKEVIQLIYEQFVQLNIQTEHTGFIMDYKTREDYNSWIADRFGTPSQVTIPYFDCIYYNHFNDAKTKGLDFFAVTLSFEEKNSFYNGLFQRIPGFPEESKKIIFEAPAFAISTVLLENIALYIENFAGVPYSDEENDTLMRFGKVFQQTYTRFLDLQKAEAQAREAKIEAALEKVRSKTMAMQKSDELADTAAVVFQQLINLGLEPNRIYITIIKDEEGACEFWITDEDGKKVSSVFNANLTQNNSFKKMYTGWKQKKKSITIDMQGEELEEYFKHLTNLNVPFKGGLKQKRRLQYIAYFSKGFIGVASPDETKPETSELLERFAAVFNLTYTRFNDLQQAEVQNKIIQAENNRKSKELEDARQLQLGMLPRELPNLPHLDIAVYMKTATEVGGDYYDFNVDSNGTLTLIVGDATGHGMMSGMMVSIMKSFFIADRNKIELKQFFENANNSIKDMQLGRLMMALAGIQITSEKIIATNAGMPSLLYFRNKSQKAGEFVSHNLPLGGMKNTNYMLKEIRYETGDTLLLMSDGFAELKNKNNEQYGYDRLKKEFMSVATKSPKEIIERLNISASEWCNGTEPEDDVTFVVVKVKNLNGSNLNT